jgi:hypothetical protein
MLLEELLQPGEVWFCGVGTDSLDLDPQLLVFHIGWRSFPNAGERLVKESGLGDLLATDPRFGRTGTDVKAQCSLGENHQSGK